MSPVLSTAVAEFRAAQAKLIAAVRAEGPMSRDLTKDLTKDLEDEMDEIAQLLLCPSGREIYPTVVRLDAAFEQFVKSIIEFAPSDECGLYEISAEDAFDLHRILSNLMSMLASTRTGGSSRHVEYVRSLAMVGQFDRAVEAARNHKDAPLIDWLIDYMEEELVLRKAGQPRSQGFYEEGIRIMLRVAREWQAKL
jgi:hypothetical protein